MIALVGYTGPWSFQIVRRSDLHKLVVVPLRWRVERTFVRISQCRRMASDYERHARKAAAFVRLAMIRVMLRRLTVITSAEIETFRIGSKTRKTTQEGRICLI